MQGSVGEVAPAAGVPVLRWRDGRGDEQARPLADAPLEALRQALPWRAFRWAHGQRHFPGWHWSSTTGGHVGYESRHELSRLLLADHDLTVVAIVSQPFLLTERVEGRALKHVPDYLLVHADESVTVVNVKTPERLASAKVAGALDWAGRCFARRGWAHDVWTGAAAPELANVRFLAGYRRAWLFDPRLLERARVVAPGRTIGEAAALLGRDWPWQRARPALLHLLWCGELVADLEAPLDRRSRLGGRP